MKYFLSFFLTSTICLACLKDQPLPMPEETLVRVLCDIHIAEAALETVTGNKKDSAAALLYQQIYTIHGVDGVLVDTAIAQIKRDPKAAEKVYLKVTEELAKLKLIDE